MYHRQEQFSKVQRSTSLCWKRLMEGFGVRGVCAGCVQAGTQAGQAGTRASCYQSPTRAGWGGGFQELVVAHLGIGKSSLQSNGEK